MSKSVYQDVEDGVPFLIETDQPMDLSCCECGLTHRLSFKKVRKGILITVKRDDRMTGQVRRRHQHLKQ